MALAPCRECSRDVSTEASHCPHCGVPDPTRASASPTSLNPTRKEAATRTVKNGSVEQVAHKPGLVGVVVIVGLVVIDAMTALVLLRGGGLGAFLLCALFIGVTIIVVQKRRRAVRAWNLNVAERREVGPPRVPEVPAPKRARTVSALLKKWRVVILVIVGLLVVWAMNRYHDARIAYYDAALKDYAEIAKMQEFNRDMASFNHKLSKLMKKRNPSGSSVWDICNSYPEGSPAQTDCENSERSAWARKRINEQIDSLKATGR